MVNKEFVSTNYSAADIYAGAWNDLNADEIIKYLGKECSYTSQWVLEELKGKDRLKEYFTRKMQLIANGTSQVKAVKTKVTVIHQVSIIRRPTQKRLRKI